MPAIKVEGLGKQYLIRHSTRTDPYATLRESLTGSAKGLIQRIKGQRQAGTRSTRETFWALKDVDFTIEHGSVTGIIGRNGAGKSTLLKLISRITEPTVGRIELEGRVSSLLEVGTGFHPELSGRENIFLNGSILGMSRREVRSKFDEIVAFAQVERFLDTPVKRYSSGMYVRLAFAIAAHLESEILLVDEVLAVGDVEFQKRCIGKMNTIAGSGRTVLFVSHNMATIKRLCQRGLYLRDGTLALDDAIDPCVSTYLEDVGSGSGENNCYQSPDADQALPPGSARLQSVRLLNDEGEPLGRVSLGTPVVIEFIVAYHDPSDLFWHSVQIRNSEGVQIYNIYDLDNRETALPPASVRRMRVRIPEWRFIADRYDLSFWIGDAGKRTVDFRESIVSFESVSEHPNLRRIPRKDLELAWEPFAWECETVEPHGPK